MCERGYYSDLQWLYRFIEKRDPVIRAVVQRRSSAISKLDWTIRYNEGVEEDASRKAIADQQLELLKEAYEAVDNLPDAIKWMCSAEFRGFAHLEKHYFNNLPSEGVNHLEPVPQWYWARKFPDARWRYNETAQSTNTGVEIDEANFIIREVEAPANEINLICFLRKNLSQKDWDGFIETYGIPPVFINLPEHSRINDKDAYQEVAEKLISDGRGVLPYGSEITTVKDGERGTNPFRDHLSYADESIVLAGTSGKLTVLNDPTGLGSGQSEVHADTFRDLAIAEGNEISAIFNKQFGDPIIMEAYPDQEILVHFALNVNEEPETSKYIEDVCKLKTAGYETNPEEVSRKTGMDVTLPEPPPQLAADGSEIPVAPGANEPAATEDADNRRTAVLAKLKRRGVWDNRSRHTPKSTPLPSKQQSAEGAVAFFQAMASDFSYVRNRLNNILKIQDPDMRRDKIQALINDLPGILKDMNKDPHSAIAMQRILEKSFMRGAIAEKV